MSEFGDDMFANPNVEVPRSQSSGNQEAIPGQKTGPQALRREVPTSGGRGWGRGPVPVDGRKFRYDVVRGRGSKPLNFSASKADRMSANDAGDMLDAIHKMYGIDRETEDRLVAFDNALFFEHSINGASLLQPGRGELRVDGMSFDIQPLKDKLGIDQRRFFRAFADEIAAVNQKVLDAYDFYDPESVEKVAFIRQIAAARGLQKYPRLIHDSSDAGTDLSYDERAAVANSKRVVLENTVNQADSWLAPRTKGAQPADSSVGHQGGS